MADLTTAWQTLAGIIAIIYITLAIDFFDMAHQLHELVLLFTLEPERHVHLHQAILGTCFNIGHCISEQPVVL